MRSLKIQELCYRRDPLEACKFGNGKWVTIGDSYAGMYNVALLDRLKSRGDGLIDLSYSVCAFVPEIWFRSTICVLVNRNRWKRILSFNGKKTFLVTLNDADLKRGRKATGKTPADFRNRAKNGKKLSTKTVVKAYHNNIRRLLRLGHNVVLITSLPKPRESVRDIYFRQLMAQTYGGASREMKKIFNKSSDEYQRLVKLDELLLMEEHPNLVQIAPREIFCLEEDDRRCLNLSGKGPIYSSGGHLSVLGARMVLDKVFEEFDRRGLGQ